MTQVVSALRIMGTLLLGATEIVLVALFAVGVAGVADGRGIYAACLFLHCIANFFIWGIEGYVLIRRGRDPSDLFFVASGSVLVVATGAAFSIFAVYMANEMPITPSNGASLPADRSPVLNFGGLGPAAAYAVLILSWLVTLLSIQSLIFAVIEKLRSRSVPAEPSESKPAQPRKSSQGSFIKHRQPKVRAKPARSKNVDWDQRPLPVTIIAVDRTTVKGSPPSGWKITEVWEEPEAMSIYEEARSMALSDGDETLVHVPLSPMRTTHADISEQV